MSYTDDGSSIIVTTGTEASPATLSNAEPAPSETLLRRMRPGDLVFFASRSWVSRAIRWVTCADVSHVGIVFGRGVSGARNEGRVALMEALWHVTLNPLDARIREYAECGGSAWWLRMADDVRERFDVLSASAWAGRQLWRRYGWLQAFFSAFRLPMPESHWLAHCSELACGYLERGGAFGEHDVNSSHCTPGDLVKVQIWDSYHQLCGPETRLRDFDTVAVADWRRAILTR